MRSIAPWLFAVPLLVIVAMAAMWPHGGVVTKTQRLDFVAETNLNNNSDLVLSLCAQRIVSRILSLPYAVQTKGFAVAPNQCDADRAVVLGFGHLHDAQAAGLIPSHVSLIPTTPFLVMAEAMWSWGVVALFLGTFLRMRRQQRARARRFSTFADTAVG